MPWGPLPGMLHPWSLQGFLLLEVQLQCHLLREVPKALSVRGMGFFLKSSHALI